MAGWSDVEAATTEDNHVLAIGDWRAGFVIADRIGTMIEIVPQVFGTNQRPTGQRGAFMYFRCGSDVVVPGAFRILNCSPEDVS